MYARSSARTPPVPPAHPARRPARAPAETAPAEGGAGSPLLIGLFLASIVVSVPFSVGGTFLYTGRLFVLLAFVPLVIAWLSGKAGRITWADGFFTLHAVWILLALTANHGLSQFKFAAVSVVEIFGAYLLGRVAVRSAGSYRTFLRYHLIVLMVLFPFALVELRTGDPLVQDIYEMIFGTSYGDTDHLPRMGLLRVQSIFSHPILWGVFCSIAIANGYYLLRPDRMKGLLRGGFGLFMTFTSLSSGPFLAGLSQIGLTLWGEMTRNKWWLLAALCAAMYAFLSVASNRGPIVLMIETATFSSGTGWSRIHQYRNAIDDVMSNPLFGIGLHDWSRPGWMSDSVDNFWLLTAMRYGIPGFVFLVLGLALNFAGIARARLASDFERNCRLGYLVASVSLYLTLATVHVWSHAALFVMFYYGAGAWLFVRHPDAPPEAAEGPEPQNASDDVPDDAPQAGSARYRREHLASRRRPSGAASRPVRRSPPVRRP